MTLDPNNRKRPWHKQTKGDVQQIPIIKKIMLIKTKASENKIPLGLQMISLLQKSEQHSQHLIKISVCFFKLCKMFCGRSRYLEHSDGAGLQQFSQGFKDEESSETKY